MGSRESVKGGNRDKVQRVSHFYKQRILLIPKLRGAFIMLRAAPSPLNLQNLRNLKGNADSIAESASTKIFIHSFVIAFLK